MGLKPSSDGPELTWQLFNSIGALQLLGFSVFT